MLACEVVEAHVAEFGLAQAEIAESEGKMSLLSFRDSRACALFRCDPRGSLQRPQADRRLRP
jgi:hypothetical protein